MSGPTTRWVSVTEWAAEPGVEALLDGYAAEAALLELGPAGAQIETYARMEASGALHVLAGYLDARMVGFLALLASTVPHYGRLIAVCESYYVEPASRGTGLGLRLLREAESRALALGAVAIMASSPQGGRAGRVLSRVGYRQATEAYIKRLAPC